jgi:zinc finger protein 423
VSVRLTFLRLQKEVHIDMPNLSDTLESQEEVRVSMPSLHGEEENTQSSQEQTEVQHMETSEGVSLDLDDLQNASGDGQQLKFIVDENGQFLQLDNHILTTDAEGNQILVQGTDQEQLQHLLQSVSAIGADRNQMLVQLQGNGEGEEEGEGATMQMGEGEEHQSQMILVQGADGETQLIDASMLQTEGGNLVLQQGEDGETRLTTADGIPVSVSFSKGGDGQLTVTMAEGNIGEEGQRVFLQHQSELEEHQSEIPQQEETSQESTTQDSKDPLAEADAPTDQAENSSTAETSPQEKDLAENAVETPETDANAEEPPKEYKSSDDKVKFIEFPRH